MSETKLQAFTSADVSQAEQLGKTMLALNNAHAPESDAFHAALGFVEIGSASIHNDSKTVRYLLRAI